MDGKFYQIVNKPKDENQAADIAINVSVSRNPTYSGSISYNDKHIIREYWKSLLLDFYNSNKPGNISRKDFFDYVCVIKEKMNSEYPSAFKCNTKGYDNGFRLAHAQKSLSVFLKHLWCMGKMGEPPFCPIDGIILNNVLKKKGAWTKLNDPETYKTYIRYIDSAVGTTMSVAEWEYICWNNLVEKRNSKVTSKKNISQKNKKKEHKSSTLNNYQNNEWAPYEPFSTLRGSTGGMEFVEPGYCLPIINQMGEIEQYRIFVAKHLRGKYEGQLFCKLEKEWGKEVGNIEDNPNAFKILNHFTDEHSINEHIVEEKDGKWHRGTGGKYAYRYATFDKTIDITDAIGFMTDIKKYVQSELNK